MRRLLATGVCWIVLLCGADQAGANWTEPSPGSLNVSTSVEADAASITVIDGVPWVAWEEYDASNRSQVYVRRLDGAAWTEVGGSLNVSTTRDAFAPAIVGVSGVPHVAWQEYDGSHYQLRVKRLEAGSWTAVGDSLNVSASQNAGPPSIADIGGVPYVTWSESDGTHTQIRVKRFDGVTWQAIGGPVNVSATRNAAGPSIASVAGIPYIAWTEDDGTANQIRVARLDGAGWVHVGGSLNVSSAQHAEAPTIAAVGGVPYVVWPEHTATVNQVFAKRLDGATWTPLGGALNASATDPAGHPSIGAVGATAVAVWHEYGGGVYHVFAKRFDGSDWALLGSPLNEVAGNLAQSPTIASIGGVPYVAWDEYDTATTRQIRVKRLEPDIGAEAAIPTATGATLTAQVNDFGLALPVGFEYGTTSAFGTATPLQSTSGAGASTVTQDIAGLAPQTSYSFRAFGSDGARQTSLGTTQAFTTLAAGGGGVPPPGVPVISNLTLTPAAFVAKKGTRVSYDDSSAATTTFTVQRPTAGRRKGGKCVQSRKRPPKSRRCTRYVKLGSFKHADTAGRNSFRFKGRVGGRKLKPGAYRLRAVARNSAGAGKAVTKRFRVKRR
jgi:hypothetical protein